MKRILIYIVAVSIVISAAIFRFCLYENKQEPDNSSEIENVINNNPYESMPVDTSYITGSGDYIFNRSVQKLDSELKKKADSISEQYRATAVQIAVIKNKELLYTYEYGYADTHNETLVTEDTKFRVASLAKFVTDSVFMKLCDLGFATIDTDISEYLGFSVRNPHYPDVAITAEMLMSHTSTILNSAAFQESRSYESSTPIKELLSDESAFFNAQPGTFYSYSNFGVAVLGAICEKITGMFFNDLAKMYFFAPLGIDASYLANQLENTDLLANIYGGEGLDVESQLSAEANPTLGQTHHLVQGNLIISAKDYCKFISMVCDGGLTENSMRLLSENSINEMFKSRIYAEGLGSGFGVEENINIFSGKTLYSHTGNSYGMYSSYIFDPKTGNGIVILTSGASVEYLDDVGIYDVCLDFTKLLFPQ